MSDTARRPAILRLRPAVDARQQMTEEVVAGLTDTPKSLPSKYFYDERGSQLFERITELPEYYLTRVETELLESSALDLIEMCRPDELIEIGSGYSRKTQILIEAMREVRSGVRYVPFDVSEEALVDAARRLVARYPFLEIQGVVGDFGSDLPRIPHGGRRLVIFLGSTIGNLDDAEQASFYSQAAAMLDEGDHLLVGYDLVKNREDLEAAYNDAAGVTAEFNRNILHVVNRELGADFPVEEFEHVSRFNPVTSNIESGLKAERAMTVTIPGPRLSVRFERGELLTTEISGKFTRERIESGLASAGLMIRCWITDARESFALALAQPKDR